MKRWPICVCLITIFVVAFPFRSPAPLIYRPGEGWTYESPSGGEKWQKGRAKDQLDVAQQAFDKKDYDLAGKAAGRVLKVWPLSDYAPQAEYLVGRCYEAKGQDEQAFKAYQRLLEKYPKAGNYEEVLLKQFAICNRFLDGQRFLVWNYVPGFPSMDKTVDMYEKVIKNGPYSEIAAQAQMNIGTARERQMRFLNDKEPYLQAAKAYERAADRYFDRPKVAADALFKTGLAYEKQARTAEYDQGTAGKAINAFKDFMIYYPDDPRVAEGKKIIASLKTEQAHGDFETAQFYEHNKRWKSAMIYYNEVLSVDPASPYAATSLKRIAVLQEMVAKSGK